MKCYNLNMHKLIKAFTKDPKRGNPAAVLIGALALAYYLKTNLKHSQSSFSIRCGPGENAVGDVIVNFKNGKSYLEGYAKDYKF
jgi:hypothetical protein